MKISAVILTGLLPCVAFAYRIDLWADYDYQGTQHAYISTSVDAFIESYMSDG
jgi:hypothetical protein